MGTGAPDLLSLGGLALLSIPLIALAFIRIWDRTLGKRNFGANLIIIGTAILWGLALSLWV